MTFTPPAHNAYAWKNRPDRTTPVNASNLQAAENNVATWVTQVIAAYDAYVQAGTALPPSVVTASTAIVTAAGTVSTPVELCDATSAPFTRTLPTAVGLTEMFTLTATTTGTHLVTVATTGGQTLIAPGAAGVSTVTLGTQASGAPYSSISVVSDGANWRIV